MNRDAYDAAKVADYRKLTQAVRAGIRDINACNSKGYSCLHLVSQQGSAECVTLLLQEGRANPNTANAPNFETPMHVAVLHGHAHLIKPLAQAGGRVNAQDHRKSTPLHLAAAGGFMTAIEELLKMHADPNRTDYKNRTALDIAEQYNQQRAARLIEANGGTRSPNAEPSAAGLGSNAVPPPPPPISQGGKPQQQQQQQQQIKGGNMPQSGPIGGSRMPLQASSKQQQQQQMGGRYPPQMQQQQRGGQQYYQQQGGPQQHQQQGRPAIYGTGGFNYADDGKENNYEYNDGEEENMEEPPPTPAEVLEQELSKIVGLEAVKDMLRTLCKQVEVDQRRARFGFKPQHNVNMLFVGNPGTGKTSMARVVAKMMKELGVLKNGQVIEVSRKDLVAEYAGQSAVKTGKKIQEALGGILFVDEAYSLKHESGQDGFGQECVNTLVQEMENKRDELVVIMAGYTKEMSSFLASNSGLASRFPVTIEFPNYTYEDMASIFQVMVDDRTLRLHADLTHERLVTLLSRNIPKSVAAKGNGRAVRNLLEAVLREQTKRLAASGTEDEDELLTIIEEDFGSLNPEKTVSELDEVLAELEAVVGIQDVKLFMRRLRAQIQITQEKKALGIPVDNGYGSLHMIFKGNPGTGKTMMARLVGKLLKALGVLSQGQLIEATRADLIGDHLGETAGKTQKLLDRALGGVLFIDEAYSLINGSKDTYGKEAVETLIKMIEDWRSELVIILAGYSHEMEKLIEKNPGIRSRFSIMIEFADYDGQNLVDIADKMLEKMNMRVSRDARVTLAQMCAKNASLPGVNNGNARWVRNLIESACMHQAQRLCNDEYRSRDDLITLVACDFDPSLPSPKPTYAQIAHHGVPPARNQQQGGAMMMPAADFANNNANYYNNNNNNNNRPAPPSSMPPQYHQQQQQQQFKAAAAAGGGGGYMPKNLNLGPSGGMFGGLDPSGTVDSDMLCL